MNKMQRIRTEEVGDELDLLIMMEIKIIRLSAPLAKYIDPQGPLIANIAEIVWKLWTIIVLS